MEVETVVVTGTRIQRLDYVSASPITTIQSEQITASADVTLDTFLNTLPQANPAGTTTSNNPGNAGQSNVNLRGLGSNRNLVLINGRRPMVSATTMDVDLNTIPQALIESIEVITGGAGAVYGADAIAGVVNLKLRDNFEGADVRATFSNSLDHWDAEEVQWSGVYGLNFGEGRGNVTLGVDYTTRQQLLKNQRSFAAVATSTTTFHPEGLVAWSGNGPTQAAVDQVFAQYDVAAGAVSAAQNLVGFNMDGTLHSRGLFNSPLNVQNFRYPIDESVNTNLYPDVYTFNFDATNILTLPLERKSFMGKADYDIGRGVTAFTQVGWTEYTAKTGLAPTPVPTVVNASLSGTDPFHVKTALIVPGGTVTQQLVIPVTNPFIPQDMRTLLASRTGNNPALVGSGADEPFLMRQRTLTAGLRESEYTNTVMQFLGGLRGDLFGDWTWEAYYSHGRTDVDQAQFGNIDAQRMQDMLEAADGGASLCAGGFNPFGRHELSPECVEYLGVNTVLKTDFEQRIAQGVVTGSLFDVPAGPVSAAIGVEYRGFEYEFDPGAVSGPVSGFNNQRPAAGTNEFRDAFAEVLIPLARDASWAHSLDVSFGYRLSESSFRDRQNDVRGGEKTSDAYKAEFTWAPMDTVLLRGSYQRSVRAPNFNELFAAGSTAPQYFDPCSYNTQARNGPNAAQLAQLCQDTGLSAAALSTFVQTPGGQLQAVNSGNPDLNPEEGDTLTFGVAYRSSSGNPWLDRLNMSLDYYSIEIKDAILRMTPNSIVAACYNYFGTNPTYDRNDPNCLALVRAGGDIIGTRLPGTERDPFPQVNGGSLKAEGIDLQLDYAFDMSQLGASDGWGTVSTNLLVNRVLTASRRLPGLPDLDYTGTVSYFGAGLGTTVPDWKVTWNTQWRVGPIGLLARGRWINAMDNRAAVEFPGEIFTGTESIWYWDVAGSWNFTPKSLIRLGVNNVFDKEPPTYAPNVQSGTDPSIFDVVGRRVYGQLVVQF